MSLIWLEDASQIAAAVKALEANATALGIAEVIYGPALLVRVVCVGGGYGVCV